MKAIIENNNASFEVDLNQPIDISIPISNSQNSAKAWYVNAPKIEAVVNEHFIGDVNLGGAVNFRNIFFNPHGNGTHTECVGHISKEFYSVNDIKQFFFVAQVVSVTPTKKANNDLEIGIDCFAKIEHNIQAIVVRTLPNLNTKLSMDYSNTNPPYFTNAVAELLNKKNIEHWLVDLPSVDKEVDGGVLACHHTFWNYPQQPSLHKTITEFIFIPDNVADGLYLLNLQFAPFVNDASPSKPLLFKIKNYVS